jgi:hypothetical protein
MLGHAWSVAAIGREPVGSQEVEEGLIEAITLVLGERRKPEPPISVRVDELKLTTA